MLGHAAGRGCTWAQQQLDTRRPPLPPWEAIAGAARAAAIAKVADLGAEAIRPELAARFLAEAERWYRRKRGG